RRRSYVLRLSVDADLAAIGAGQPEYRLRQPGSTRADQSVDPDNLAPVELEAHVSKMRRLGQAAHFKNLGLVGRLVAARKELGERFAHHLAHQVGFAPVSGWTRTQLYPVAHDGNAVGDGEYLR